MVKISVQIARFRFLRAVMRRRLECRAATEVEEVLVDRSVAGSVLLLQRLVPRNSSPISLRSRMGTFILCRNLVSIRTSVPKSSSGGMPTFAPPVWSRRLCTSASHFSPPSFSVAHHSADAPSACRRRTVAFRAIVLGGTNYVIDPGRNRPNSFGWCFVSREPGPVVDIQADKLSPLLCLSHGHLKLKSGLRLGIGASRIVWNSPVFRISSR